ncbi:uncharacterized protein G2W53_012296 [Senna tora]|uniref:Uncharacterized protein n=1 Tax=Senna tora TaxID=362788 RepID=A0A834TWK1_9FABA|nr:uncharacterized protein G2W53_012296 [Senna tora]
MDGLASKEGHTDEDMIHEVVRLRTCNPTARV